VSKKLSPECTSIEGITMSDEMDESAVKKTVQAYLDSARVDRAADYVARGRKFSALPLNDLTDQWRDSITAMANEPSQKVHRDHHTDYGAEFQLRGLDEPYDDPVAKAELERFMSATRRIIESRLSDPDERERIEDEIGADLKAFLSGTENAN
jgi:hypothetical protein